MRTERRILLATCLLPMAVGLSSIANASATKVGNGDDGGDLEGAQAITSGLIWETRTEAIELVKSLNVKAVPGLGRLHPELERTELLMTKMDVRPDSPDLPKMEISEDGKSVYARTFAEPHAATRFFPASLQLSREQLVSLHVHEALHRSLPETVREDETIVKEITMAITSPGATFDRVYAVASPHTLASLTSVASHAPSSGAGQLTSTAAFVMPEPTKATAYYEYRLHSTSSLRALSRAPGIDLILHGIGTTFSPFGVTKFRGMPIETRIDAKLIYVQGMYGDPGSIGPANVEARVATPNDDAQMGVFGRMTVRLFDEALSSVAQDRDVLTAGVFYSQEAGRSYFSADVFYTLPSNGQSHGNSYPLDENSHAVPYAAVYSASIRSGVTSGKFSYGAIGELHFTPGESTNGDSEIVTPTSYARSSSGQIRPRTTILTLGPEVTAKLGKLKLGLHGKWMLRDSPIDLGGLGDTINRGYGRGQLGLTAAFDL